MKKLIFVLALLIFAGIGLFTVKTHAAQLGVSIESSDGSGGEALLDDDYNSTEQFDGGTSLTIRSNEAIDSLYIKWDSIPSAYTIQDGTSSVSGGENGFLHEYVKLSGTADSVTLNIPDGGAKIADIYAFSAGDLPDFVQQWQPSWDKADILFISTHSDDEVLFFGGMIPIYTNEDTARVQVAYFSDFFLTESYRNHELLDGIWTMGVDHYPQLGKFYDNYSESLEEAEAQFDHDQCLSYITETIRRFQPQVVVTHDVNGEYGHGGHQYVSKLVREAVEITGDSSQYPESASQYGAWDVPKTYLHLYPENPIEMPTRVPLADFGGKNALEVAKEAYLKHGSQQWMWFYVDDGYDEYGNPNGYQFSCAKYGLYRSTVGNDTSGNDVLDNLVTYAKQEAAVQPETVSPETESEPETSAAPSEEPTKKKGSPLVVIIIIVVVLILIVISICLISASRRKKQREQMERRRRSIQNAQRSAQYGRRQGSSQSSRSPQGGRSQGSSQTRPLQGGRSQGSSQSRPSQGGRSQGSSQTRPSQGGRSQGSSQTRPPQGRRSQTRPSQDGRSQRQQQRRPFGPDEY